MTGMKEGAGENPFAEDSTPTETESEEQPDSSDTSTSTDDRTETSDTSSSNQSSRQQSMQIPYKFRRDGVQDGRNRVPLFLQEDTKSAERDALRELEDRFDDDVSLTDLREALVKVGLQHLDEAEQHLEEWGYGMTFD
ncbi:hypothetical protein [Haladaptatus halobius]|uniref:hypothetical protein n=1 Tax=Haladaptatus halobius TaxID=2884875 RepID=UPI001D0BA44F|nr:hypothetical protein [Haladaptatus halobius]